MLIRSTGVINSGVIVDGFTCLSMFNVACLLAYLLVSTELPAMKQNGFEMMRLSLQVTTVSHSPANYIRGVQMKSYDVIVYVISPRVTSYRPVGA